MPAVGKDRPQEETVVYGPLEFLIALLLRKTQNRREPRRASS